MTVAAVMTYDSLVNDIQTYLERTDDQTLEKIPQFIMLAEQIIASEIKFLGNLTVVTSTMVASENVIPKPSRWRKTVSMNVTVAGKRQPVLLRTYEYIREYWPSPTSTSEPLYFCDYDYQHWLVGPTPALGYAYEVLYYERIPPLSSENQTNWLTQNAPNAMLYGTLLQAMPFLKNDARAIFQQKYSEAINALKTEDTTRVGDRQTIAVDS
jgi:hypothetical protein